MKQKIRNWDYNLPENWQPKTERQWLWYLGRKINYGDWQGLKREWLKKHFPKLKNHLDLGKRRMLELYLEGHG